MSNWPIFQFYRYHLIYEAIQRAKFIPLKSTSSWDFKMQPTVEWLGKVKAFHGGDQPQAPAFQGGDQPQAPADHILVQYGFKPILLTRLFQLQFN